MKRVITMILAIAMIVSLCACGEKAPTWQEQYDLGVRYLSEGNYEEAIIAFTAAIEIDPKQSLSYVGRGQAYVFFGETEENLSAAEADFEQALELDERNADAWLGLADIYIHRGDYEQAMKILREGLGKSDDSRIQDVIDEIEELLIPKLTEIGRADIEWAYSLLKNEDISTMSREGDQLYIDRQYILPFDEYIGLCFDGKELSREFDGVALKVLSSRRLYYGQLVSGEPNGEGINYIYLPQANGAVPRYGLYKGMWKNGKANGEGTYTEGGGSSGGEQHTTVYIGEWLDDAINGEVIEQFYVNRQLNAEWHYACENGSPVLDQRWSRDSFDGSYILPSILEYGAGVSICYQPEFRTSLDQF